MSDQDLIQSHQHSSNHRQEMLSSEMCGCFYCLTAFTPDEICEWVDEDTGGVGQTAVCPKCGIDAVIGSNSGYPISQEFLEKMHRYWF